MPMCHITWTLTLESLTFRWTMITSSGLRKSWSKHFGLKWETDEDVTEWGEFLYWMTDRQTAELPVKQCRPWWAGYIVQVGRTGENWRLQLEPAACGPGPFSLSRSHFGRKLTRMAGAQWYKLQEIIELDKIYRK